MEQLHLEFTTRSWMPREDRKDQLYDIVRRSDVPLTMLEIARRVGLRKSAHLRDMLEELVDERTLAHGKERVHPSGNNAITYRDALPF